MSKLAREKQDAEQFIRQIAPEYLGVYVVDRETDEFREILVPEYFRWNAEENGGCFSKAMEDYIASMVALRYHDMVEQVLDYDRVYIQLKAGMDVEVYYRRLDDVPIKLQIKPYSDKKEEQNLSLWIFINDDTGGAQMKRFQRDKLIMDKLCYDFTAVYYIDLNTGSFTTLKLGRNTNAENLQMEDEVELENFDLYARQYGEKYIAPEDRQEFLAWFNCQSLKEKLLGREVITYHYRSLPNQSGKKFFDTQVMKVHVDDEEFKVFMSFRHVDDILEPEVSTQEKLQRALAELELNNEIISTIGKSYDAIFRIDLQADYFEEISTTDGIHKLTGREGCASERLHLLCRRMVSEPYQELTEEFCNLRKLGDKLAHEDTLITEYQLKSGNWQKLRFIVKKRNAKGQVTNVLCCLRNISETKRLEENLRYKEAVAKRESEAKNRFLSNMSHDIRTPLNGVIGMVDLASRYPDNLEIQDKCRRRSREALKYLLSLLNDVLDMNKLENQEYMPQNITFDIAEFLDGINKDAEAKARENGVNFVIEWGKNVIRHRFLEGNPVYAGRILANIIDNAIKFTPSGHSVHVWFKEESSHWNNVVYAFYCRDYGIGMSEDFLSQAFEMFTQEAKSDHTKYAGSGLGLSIAKKLADKLRGTIELASNKGEGTEAIIRIPFKIGNQVQLDYYGDYQEISLAGKRILSVDDNELNRDVAKFMMEDNGIKVEEAENGQEAVDKFWASKPGYYDAILMDIMMPGLNGWEATEKIRAMKRWDAERVSIIALSANSFADDIVSSKLAGMDTHLSKPLDEKKLLETIKQCLSKHMNDKKL